MFVIKYFCVLQDMNVEFKSTRVILIGSTNVGKTSLLSQIVDGKISDTTPTTGSAFSQLQTKNPDHPLVEFWDTAGMERYRSINKSFYKEAQAAILVFDLTCYQTFEDLNSWLEEFENEAPANAVVVLVGNKADLADQIEVEEDEVKTFANTHQMNYYRTSAKDASGVDAMLNDLLSIIPKRNVINTKLIEEDDDKKCC